MGRLSYKKAVAEKCKDCIYDDALEGGGGVNQQIATCTITDCALHPVRPINKHNTKLTKRILKVHGIKEEDLDDRARECL